MTKKYVKIYEGDKLIREGEPRKTDMNDDKNSFYGFTFTDAIKLVIYVGMLLVFLVKSDNRISRLEEIQLRQTAIMEKIIDFGNNSDKWHSIVTGYTFQNGKPDGTTNNRGIFKKDELYP